MNLQVDRNAQRGTAHRMAMQIMRLHEVLSSLPEPTRDEAYVALTPIVDQILRIQNETLQALLALQGQMAEKGPK